MQSFAILSACQSLFFKYGLGIELKMFDWIHMDRILFTDQGLAFLQKREAQSQEEQDRGEEALGRIQEGKRG